MQMQKQKQKMAREKKIHNFVDIYGNLLFIVIYVVRHWDICVATSKIVRYLYDTYMLLNRFVVMP